MVLTGIVCRVGGVATDNALIRVGSSHIARMFSWLPEEKEPRSGSQEAPPAAFSGLTAMRVGGRDDCHIAPMACIVVSFR